MIRLLSILLLSGVALTATPKLEIKAQTFELDTTTLDISSTNKNIKVFDTDGTTEYVRLGEISTIVHILHF